MIHCNTLSENRFARRLFGSEDTAGRVPWLNEVIFVYVSLVILVFASERIVPVQSFIAATPLYHLQRWLGLFGAALLAVDLFTNKGLWRGPCCILLYGILLIAAFSALRYAAYGEMRNNLFLLCWSAVQFGLLYSCAFRFSPEELWRRLAWLFGVLITVWVIACLVSLYQYVEQIGYTTVPDPLAEDQTPVRLGFIKNRLFGVFNPINHAAYVSLMLFFGALYYFRQSRRVAVRVLLVFCALVLVSYILLSASRSAWVALAVGLFAGSFLLLRSRQSGRKRRGRFRRCFAGALGVLAAAFVVLLLYRFLLMKLPEPVDSNFVEFSQGDLVELQRTGLEDDVSNGRISIWSDYCSLWREIGLTGLSPGSYMVYIMEHHPELYIVEYIRQTAPTKLAGGVIYHTHSGYLLVYVATGVIGLLLLLAYLLVMAIRCLRHIFRHVELREEWILSLVLVLTGLIAAAFDKGVFLDSTPQSFLFWLFAGIAAREASDRNGKDGKNK